MENSLVIATSMNTSKESEINTILLVESIRSFAGSLSNVPIWCFIRDTGGKTSEKTRTHLLNLDVKFESYTPEKEYFPFTNEVKAAAAAEEKAKEVDILTWLNPNCLILKEPVEFLIPADKYLGYRPVHHTLIGSLFDEPLDIFWSEVYRKCGVTNDNVFPMTTHIDGKVIRPYFNSGFLVVRPSSGLLKSWEDVFLDCYSDDVFQVFYEDDLRYRIFIHQAILSGVILNHFEKNQMIEISGKYNYPLHLIGEDVNPNRPVNIDELVSIRHEGFYEDPDWRKDIPANDDLKKWLAERISPLI